MRIHDVSLAARGRWHTLSATLIGLWIFTGLGLLIAASLGAPVVWWDIIHPFTIGALTTAIIVFSTHFTEALTRTAGGDYRGVGSRVGLVQLGLILPSSSPPSPGTCGSSRGACAARCLVLLP